MRDDHDHEKPNLQLVQEISDMVKAWQPETLAECQEVIAEKIAIAEQAIAGLEEKRRENEADLAAGLVLTLARVRRTNKERLELKDLTKDVAALREIADRLAKAASAETEEWMRQTQATGW